MEPSAPAAVAAVVSTIAGDFAPYAGLTVETPPEQLARERVLIAASSVGYVTVAAREGRPRGARERVVFVVVATGSEQAQTSAKLQRVLDAHLPAAGDLSELYLILEEEVARKPNIRAALEKVAEAVREQNANIDGEPFYFTVRHFHNFAFNVPAHCQVPRHEYADPDEILDLERRGTSRRDFPVIFDTDPPAVWLRARDGDILRITRPSLTAVSAITYRVVKAAGP